MNEDKNSQDRLTLVEASLLQGVGATLKRFILNPLKIDKPAEDEIPKLQETAKALRLIFCKVSNEELVEIANLIRGDILSRPASCSSLLKTVANILEINQKAWSNSAPGRKYSKARDIANGTR